VAGKAQVSSAQSQVTASEIALNGVREEAKAGQRTTLDALNTQQAPGQRACRAGHGAA
jgi:outer membrane protein